jgi:hypothetical protein
MPPTATGGVDIPLTAFAAGPEDAGAAGFVPALSSCAP